MKVLNMEETLSDIVNRLFTFFTEHFYEIILLLLIFVVIDVVFFVLQLNKKDRVVILHASCLPRQLLGKIACLP
jgi:type II secretory pathway component PulF